MVRDQARCAMSGCHKDGVTQRGPILARKCQRMAMGSAAPCGATRTSLSMRRRTWRLRTGWHTLLVGSSLTCIWGGRTRLSCGRLVTTTDFGHRIRFTSTCQGQNTCAMHTCRANAWLPKHDKKHSATTQNTNATTTQHATDTSAHATHIHIHNTRARARSTQ